jgi:hypothetical protein
MKLEDLKGMKSVYLAPHCDDEIIFGFPFLKHVNTIISCTDDKTHPTRQWCKRRSEAFAEIGKLVGAKTICLRHDSGFAKKEHKPLVAFATEVQGIIKDFDVICTVNAWGEYGHLDHILIHQLARMTGKPVFTTDICMQADWYKVTGYDQGEIIGEYHNDLKLYDQCMQIYRNFNAMGWSYPPIKSCNVVRVQ